MKRFRLGFVLSAFVAIGSVAACGWDPARPFDREAPQVNEALKQYDAGEAGSAADLLEDYLRTGICKEGNIGVPLRVREKGSGSFDLGLALFKIGESYGHRFGDEENDAGFLDPNLKTLRGAQVDCALRIVRSIAEDVAQPVHLRARARYLEGNLLFLTAAYKEAVTAYDHALELAPGMGDAGPIGARSDSGVVYVPDPIGRDAAWNRAVALRRIEDKEKKDAGQPDSGNGDGGGQNSPDGGQDQNKDGGGDDKNKDAGNNNKNDNKDAGKDSGKDDQNNKKDDPPKDEKDAGANNPPPPPPSRQNQDDRILDQLENAPTVQQEAAKKHAKKHGVKGTADK
jgi:hypothetical protein